MTRDELQRIRDWASRKIVTGAEPPWSWYQHMKLREALDAIIAGRDASVVVTICVLDVVDCGRVVDGAVVWVVVVVSSVVDTAVVAVDEGAVVVLGGISVVVVFSSVVVVEGVGNGSEVKNSGCTISQPAPSIFHANMKHVPPPFSYIHASIACVPAAISIKPVSVALHP